MAWRRLTRIVERWGSVSAQEAWSDFLSRSFQKRLQQTPTLAEKVAMATGKSPIRSNQRQPEILSLLNELEKLKPRTLCEIGCDRGGTLSLFASVAASDATILSIDPSHRLTRCHGYRWLARDRQHIVPLAADSHEQKTLSRVRQELRERPLDFLFIDGDHSFEGVMEDYRMYAPLLRPGGILAFHDIVPEAAGSDTYVGGVPRFFREHVQSHHDAVCYIERAEQDGFGIGMVRWPNAERAQAILASLAAYPPIQRHRAA